MSEETARGATRQRRKRKWDQPAEAVGSVGGMIPGLVPFSTAALGGIGTMPGVFPYTNYFPALQADSQNIPGVAKVQQNAAAIVQKFNQELVTKGILQAKIQDEIIAREITINDAEPGVRYKLTKRQTQEEIQLKTGAVVITRGRYRSPNGPTENEKPLYLHISAGVNLKDTAARVKAVDQAADMVEEMLKHGQQTPGAFRSPQNGVIPNGNVPVRQALNIFVGFEADPSFNLVGRIRGPNDQYINHIMNETGASVVLRGRGSGNKEGVVGEELPQALHLQISSDNVKSFEDAKTLAENLVETIRADSFHFKLPSYQFQPQVPAARPSPVMSYPSPHPPPYQASVVNHSQGLYRGYFPAVGPYTPVHHASQAPFPPFPSSVPASLEQQALPAMNPHVNMVPPAKKVYGAVPPPTELLGDRLTGHTDVSAKDCSEESLPRSIRERFSQSSNGSQSSSPNPTTFLPPNSSAGDQNQANVLLSSHNLVFMSKPSSLFVSQEHLNVASPLQASTILGSQTSQALMSGQSVSPAYSQALLTTSYSGYSGVYPEVSPLQQVGQALQRPPLPVSVKPLPNSTFLSTLTKAQSSSFQDKHTEKQPAQRRKFQEFPVAPKESTGDEQQQGRRQVTLSGPDASTQSKDPGPPSSRSLPLPAFFPSAAPGRTATPPSMQNQHRSILAAFKQPDDLDLSHGTGLKLVEYGEEDDETFAGEAVDSKSEPFSNGKPFWAS